MLDGIAEREDALSCQVKRIRLPRSAMTMSRISAARWFD
jgi:hypothetical protein